MFKEPTSKFVKIKCDKCNNEQTIFSKVATKVECLVCHKPLAEPTGGKTKFQQKPAAK